jgi:ATP-dependent Clp protease protease subunit
MNKNIPTLPLPALPPNLEKMFNLHPSKYFESYIKLSENRIIFLNEDFTTEVSSALSAWLLYYDHLDPKEDITIFINSVGGDVAALTQIYDVIQMISAPVKTICIGKCYSAGAALLATGAKGKRFIFKHAEVMIHGIQCIFPIVGDTQIDSENYLDFIKQYNDMFIRLLAKHTGHPLEKIREDCLGDMFFTAEQAVKYNLADSIVEEIV